MDQTNTRACAFLSVGLLVSILYYLTTARPFHLRTSLSIFLDACSNGEMAKVTSYIGRDPQLLDAMDSGGWSCLINASKHNRVALVKKLLEMGASTGTSDMQHSALRGAAMFGYEEIVSMLVESGCIIDVYSKFHRTPLMGAAMNGHIDVVRQLLAAGADRSLKNDDGMTAEDLAEQNGHLTIATFLRSAEMSENPE
jgi:ankyrin repeat protein